MAEHAARIDERVGALPEELLGERRWLLWRYETRAGEPTKVPCVAGPGVRRGGATNPILWRTLDEAQQHRHRFDGLGVALGTDPATGRTLSGVDLDDVRDPATGELTEAAAQIVRDLSSYTELSPSGRGLHVLMRGELPDGESAGKWPLPGGGSVEVYSRTHYFTFTGFSLAGTPTTLHDRGPELAALWRSRPQKPTAPRPAGAPAATPTLSDSDVLKKAFGATNGATVEALWRGDDLHYPSPSEADAALGCHLAFYCTDAAQVKRLLLRSERVREKWLKRPSWLDKLAEHASEHVTSRYSGALPDPPAGEVRIPRALLTSGLNGGALLLAELVCAGVPDHELRHQLGDVCDRTLRRYWAQVREAFDEVLLRTRPTERFFTVRIALLTDAALPIAARVAGLHVAAAMRNGRAKPGHEVIARRMGRERARVTEDIQRVVSAGHLCTSGPALFNKAQGRRQDLNSYWWPRAEAETKKSGHSQHVKTEVRTPARGKGVPQAVPRDTRSRTQDQSLAVALPEESSSRPDEVQITSSEATEAPVTARERPSARQLAELERKLIAAINAGADDKARQALAALKGAGDGLPMPRVQTPDQR